jgi:uncharacterized protein YuzB (UPF0349 family)
MAKIKFCENNFALGTDDVVERLKEDKVAVEVEPCLGYCGECAEKPFALVDDDYIEADSQEELYDKITEIL